MSKSCLLKLDPHAQLLWSHSSTLTSSLNWSCQLQGSTFIDTTVFVLWHDLLLDFLDFVLLKCFNCFIFHASHAWLHEYTVLFARLFQFTFLIFSYSSLFLYLISLCGFLFFLFLFSCPHHCSDLVHFCVKILLFCLYLLSVFSLELCKVILFFPCVCLYFLVPAFSLVPQPLDFDAKQCSTVITAVNVLDWCLHSWAQ